MNSPNTFGRLFQVHSFGESHGEALGVVIDGCPAGVPFSYKILIKNLDRRRPGHWPWTSSRNEPDIPEVLSGVFDGKTLGTPIAICVRNKDAKHKDYTFIKNNPRRGHADDLWKEKFGYADYRGGGRASGRETLSRVIAGSVAKMALGVLYPDFKTIAFTRGVGSIFIQDDELKEVEKLFKDNNFPETFPAGVPHKEKSKKVAESLIKFKEKGESVGSLVELWAEGLPKGLGQPVFQKFKSDLSMALMSLGATTGLEIGMGFSSLKMLGNQFHSQSSHYGGLRGGFTTGERLVVRVVFKPPSSRGDISKQGRHDPCIGPRALSIVESMCSILVLDHLLLNRLNKI